MKIFVGVVEISGFYRNLHSVFQKNGFNASHYLLYDHKFNYSGDFNKSSLSRIIFNLNKFQKNKNKFIKIFLYIPYGILILLFFFQSLYRYDVFIFGFGRTILPYNFDLPIYKFFGKTVIGFLTHGSEVRPPFIDGSYNLKDFNNEKSYLKFINHRQKQILRMIKIHERYCDSIVGYIGFSHFFKRKIVDIYQLGIPVDNQRKPREKNNVKRAIKVLHAPSNKTSKGSKLIIKQLNKLNDEKQLNLKLILVENEKNKKVLELINECDIVIDQLFSDTLMSGLALEAIINNKPVVIGGYELDKVKSYFKKRDISYPPTLSVNPTNLYNELCDILNDNERINNSINGCSYYIHDSMNTNKIAKNMHTLIDKNIPENWFFDPKKNDFRFGFGYEMELFFSTQKLINDCGYHYLYDDITSPHLRLYFKSLKDDI